MGELERFAKNSSTRSIKDQIEMYFALGKAYDDAGRYADAFQEWLEGNALKRQQTNYDEAAMLAELDQVRSNCTAEMIQKSQGTGHPSSRPVFIVGMSRSGSTLVEQILASHPQVLRQSIIF